jgi:hypothetical protein
MSGKSLVNGDGESYCGIVPTKQPNKSEQSPAEVVEGRPKTKENTRQPNLGRSPSRENRPSGLERVREAARKNGKLKFTALLHHVGIDLLRVSYNSLKKTGGAGSGWDDVGSVGRRPGGTVGRPTWTSQSRGISSATVAKSLGPEIRWASTAIGNRDGQGFWIAQKRLSQGRFVWWLSGKEPARRLEAHPAQSVGGGQPRNGSGAGASTATRMRICAWNLDHPATSRQPRSNAGQSVDQPGECVVEVESSCGRMRVAMKGVTPGIAAEFQGSGQRSGWTLLVRCKHLGDSSPTRGRLTKRNIKDAKRGELAFYL